MRITKSHYMTAKQCLKALWLQENKPAAVNQSMKNDQVMEMGREIGVIARELFPGGTLVEFDKDIDKAAAITDKMVKSTADTIYEAAFALRDSYTMCDILHKTKDGFEIYEVKSATGLKPEYIDDTAFQYYLLLNNGLNVSRIYIVHINNTYERHGKLELDKLFTIEDVSDKVIASSQNIPGELDNIRSILKEKDEPCIPLGEYCMQPYECTCKDYCWCNIPKNSVFDLAGMPNKKKFELYNQGVVTFLDVIDRKLKLSYKAAQVQIQCQLDNKGLLDKVKIRGFLGSLTFPLYFLDFETFQQPIPLYDKVKPYEKIPFQYSLHYLDCMGGQLEHKEFLAKEGQDPRRELAESLVRDIPQNVCVLAYNMPFEKSVIRDLAYHYKDLNVSLMNIHDNIKDLMIPFQEKYYYTNEMKGSYSIKHVLPALFPNDDQLNYKRLNIQNGEAAMQAFACLHLKDAAQIQQVRKDLLSYCYLDTLAMVKIWEKLIEVSV